jgi:hypothetical protein
MQREEKPMAATARVRVAKSGPEGRPMALVIVPGGISASDLGGVIQKVTTNEKILNLGGLRACTGCKSGLDITILDMQELVEVTV